MIFDYYFINLYIFIKDLNEVLNLYCVHLLMMLVLSWFMSYGQKNSFGSFVMLDYYILLFLLYYLYDLEYYFLELYCLLIRIILHLRSFVKSMFFLIDFIHFYDFHQIFIVYNFIAHYYVCYCFNFDYFIFFIDFLMIVKLFLSYFKLAIIIDQNSFAIHSHYYRCVK